MLSSRITPAKSSALEAAMRLLAGPGALFSDPAGPVAIFLDRLEEALGAAEALLPGSRKTGAAIRVSLQVRDGFFAPEDRFGIALLVRLTEDGPALEDIGRVPDPGPCRADLLLSAGQIRSLAAGAAVAAPDISVRIHTLEEGPIDHRLPGLAQPAREIIAAAA